MKHALILLMMLALTGPALADNDEDEGSAYLELSPDFVVNIGGPDAGRNYVRAEVTLRFRGEARRDQAETHEPWLRHELVMMLSDLEVDEARSSEGQSELRERALEVLNERLSEEEGEELIREVLFPGFVVQSR